MNAGITVTCPTCKSAVIWNSANPHKPFCCARCKLIDLGDWATEAHRIPGEDALAHEPQAPEDY
jgi:uncharacterized protein